MNSSEFVEDELNAGLETSNRPYKEDPSASCPLGTTREYPLHNDWTARNEELPDFHQQINDQLDFGVTLDSDLLNLDRLSSWDNFPILEGSSDPSHPLQLDYRHDPEDEGSLLFHGDFNPQAMVNDLISPNSLINCASTDLNCPSQFDDQYLLS